MFTNPEKIMHLFSDDRYCNDLKAALIALRNINIKRENEFTPQDMANTIVELYQKSYQCMLENRDELKIIIHRLLQDKSISGSDFYNITRADSPLKQNEIGPLPKKHEADYQYRSPSPFHELSIDPSQTKQYQDENGNQVTMQYLLHGNKQSTTIIDSNQVKTTTIYQPDGNTIKLVNIEYPDKSELYRDFQPDGITIREESFIYSNGNITRTIYESDGKTIKEVIEV